MTIGLLIPLHQFNTRTLAVSVMTMMESYKYGTSWNLFKYIFCNITIWCVAYPLWRKIVCLLEPLYLFFNSSQTSIATRTIFWLLESLNIYSVQFCFLHVHGFKHRIKIKHSNFKTNKTIWSIAVDCNPECRIKNSSTFHDPNFNFKFSVQVSPLSKIQVEWFD